MTKIFDRPRRFIAVPAFIFLFSALPLTAQEPPVPPPQQQLPDSVQEMLAEYQQKQQQIQALQIQALEGSEELQVRQGAVQATVQAAMLEVDPEFEARVDRLQALEGEAMAAQQAQDMAKLQSLMDEAEEIQTRLRLAQETALERPDVKEEVETFQEELVEEMAKHDPQAPQLWAELQELEERLEAAIGTG